MDGFKLYETAFLPADCMTSEVTPSTYQQPRNVYEQEEKVKRNINVVGVTVSMWVVLLDSCIAKEIKIN
jgi:hypothetical protein